jgi:ribose/xylose/arabinose/galactoside ABC-type transport system permease subunit
MHKSNKKTITIVFHILGVIAFLAGISFLIYENEFRKEHSTLYVLGLITAAIFIGISLQQLWCDVIGCCQYCNMKCASKTESKSGD